jgi:hypothetical protein
MAGAKRPGRNSMITYPELLLPSPTPERGQQRNHIAQEMLESVGSMPRSTDIGTTLSDRILAALFHRYLGTDFDLGWTKTMAGADHGISNLSKSRQELTGSAGTNRRGQ